jgi:hypothetical protein
MNVRKIRAELKGCGAHQPAYPSGAGVLDHAEDGLDRLLPPGFLRGGDGRHALAAGDVRLDMDHLEGHAKRGSLGLGGDQRGQLHVVDIEVGVEDAVAHQVEEVLVGQVVVLAADVHHGGGYWCARAAPAAAASIFDRRLAGAAAAWSTLTTAARSGPPEADPDLSPKQAAVWPRYTGGEQAAVKVSKVLVERREVERGVSPPVYAAPGSGGGGRPPPAAPIDRR